MWRLSHFFRGLGIPSFICFLLFRSKKLILKSDGERFTHIVLYKRTTMSNLLKSFFTKERSLAIRSLKKSNVSDSPMIRANCSQKWKNERIAFKNSYFSYVLDSFPPFYAQERIAPVALYKRLTMSDSLRSLMTTERREKFALFHEWIAFSLLHSQ